MNLGDLVSLKIQGNGQPRIGIIYEHAPTRYYSDEVEYKCMWDVPMWNDTLWREYELVVISESR
jgi:hypothetical protein